MQQWPADETLTGLVRRYYGGEAGLWEEIRMLVYAEVRRRELGSVPIHFRFRPSAEGYDVIIEDASAWRVDDGR